MIFYVTYYRVIECSELTIKNGSCDPFATVTVIYSNGKQISKRTKVKKKTASPYFNETFVFEVKRNVFYYSLLSSSVHTAYKINSLCIIARVDRNQGQGCFSLFH